MNRMQVGWKLIRAGFKRDRPRRSLSLGTTFHRAIGRKGWRLVTVVPPKPNELNVSLQLHDGRSRGTLFRVRDESGLDTALDFIVSEARRLLADDERLLKCPSCHQFMSVKEGPQGLFLACDNWREEGKQAPWHCDGKADARLVPAERVWQ